MTRPTIALLLLSTGCASIPGFGTARVSLAPEYVVLKVSGDTAMQSPNGTAVSTNPEQPLRNFGAGAYDDDIGGLVRIGDGFSGVELGYLHVDNYDTQTGQLSYGWGNLVAGDVVSSRFEGDEFRLRYIGRVLGREADDEIGYALGFGSTVAWRDFDFRAEEQTGTRAQEISLHSDAVLFAAVRARVEFAGFGATIDYGYSPDLTLGDFEGDQHDLEVIGSYRFADQEVTVFAGYRWSKMPAEGTEGPLAWEMDLTLEGYVLGVEVAF